MFNYFNPDAKDHIINIVLLFNLGPKGHIIHIVSIIVQRLIGLVYLDVSQQRNYKFLGIQMSYCICLHDFKFE